MKQVHQSELSRSGPLSFLPLIGYRDQAQPSRELPELEELAIHRGEQVAAQLSLQVGFEQLVAGVRIGEPGTLLHEDSVHGSRLADIRDCPPGSDLKRTAFVSRTIVRNCRGPKASCRVGNPMRSRLGDDRG